MKAQVSRSFLDVLKVFELMFRCVRMTFLFGFLAPWTTVLFVHKLKIQLMNDLHMRSRKDSPFIVLNILYMEWSSQSAIKRSLAVAVARLLSRDATRPTLDKICLGHNLNM